MGDYIFAGIMLVISVAMFVISFRSFREKGFLFNNAYIYASKAERENMNKKPYYRQSAYVFLVLGIVFLIIAAEIILKTGWLLYVEILCLVFVLIYGIWSSVTISGKK